MKHCIHCLTEIEQYPCPHCGSAGTGQDRNPSALPALSILDGKYLVGRVLGQGGFGKS